ADRLPRPPAARRGRRDGRAPLHARQRGALPRGGRGPRDRRAGRRRAHPSLHPVPRGLAAPVVPAVGDRRPRRLRALRARGDRPQARPRGRLPPRTRGQAGQPARPLRLGLRHRLGALRRRLRRRRRRRRVRRLAPRRDRRAGLAPILRDADRGCLQRPVRHPRPPGPGQGVGRGTPAARSRSALLLRAGGGGHGGGGHRRRIVDRRAAQAGGRALSESRAAGHGRRRRVPDRPLQRCSRPGAHRLRVRPGGGGARSGRDPRGLRLRAPPPPLRAARM
ncbi:MAG: Histidinol-phosphatase, partial [uncultured Solirubrobacteraceae bacterium]